MDNSLDMEEEEVELCSICETPLYSGADEVTTVTKGIAKMVDCSRQRGDNKWINWASLNTIRVHATCRKKYTVRVTYKVTPPQVPQPTNMLTRHRNPSSDRTPAHLPAIFHSNNVTTISPSSSPPSSHAVILIEISKKDINPSAEGSSEPTVINDDINNDFDFKHYCFICGTIYQKPGSLVQNDGLKDRFLWICNQKKDSLSMEIENRIKSVESLQAVEARYHTYCYGNFTYIPNENSISHKKMRFMDESLEKISNFIEEKGVTKFTFADLRAKLGDDLPKNNSILYTKLQQKYGKKISIHTSKGDQDPVIYFNNDGIPDLCEDIKKKAEQMDASNKVKVMKAAADILRFEILAHRYNKDTLPASDDFLKNIDDYPEALNDFLDMILLTQAQQQTEDLIFKKHSIAHALVSSIRPRQFLSTLQFAVGTYIYRKTGSKKALDILSKFGLCSSYEIVRMYESIANDNPAKSQLVDNDENPLA